MAYNDSISPAQVLNSEITATRNVLNRIGGWFAKLGQNMLTGALVRKRFETIEMLNAMSDSQLDDLNIKRDDIVQYVFRDFSHL
ncbi:MAG: hypothetical protein ABJL67_07685 [Sulfitobacter sp.]